LSPLSAPDHRAEGPNRPERLKNAKTEAKVNEVAEWANQQNFAPAQSKEQSDAQDSALQRLWVGDGKAAEAGLG
jgi:hypothetical protein